MAAIAENAVKNDETFINCPSDDDAVADKKSEFQRDVQKLVDLLSKLNPSAKEFFPSYYSASPDRRSQNELGEAPAGAALAAHKDSGSDTSSGNRRVRLISWVFVSVGLLFVLF